MRGRSFAKQVCASESHMQCYVANANTVLRVDWQGGACSTTQEDTELLVR